MNKLFLVAASLLTLSVSAAPASNRANRLAALREQARQTLGGCQKRVESLEAQIAQKEAKIKALQNRLSSMSGQAQYADEINKYNEGVRKAIAEREQLVSQRGSAVGEYNQNLRKFGSKCHINYNSQNGCCDVVDASQFDYKNRRDSY